MQKTETLSTTQYGEYPYVPIGGYGFLICEKGVISYHKVIGVIIKFTEDFGLQLRYNIQTSYEQTWVSQENFFPTFEEAKQISDKWGVRDTYHLNDDIVYNSELKGVTRNPLGWNSPIKDFIK